MHSIFSSIPPNHHTNNDPSFYDTHIRLTRTLQATKEQKVAKQWTASVPDPDATLQLEGELLQRQQRYAVLEDKQKHLQVSDVSYL